ncbi:MAG: hypothetical protein ACU0B7_00045, partial [Paracoccaceae bacterium]
RVYILDVTAACGASLAWLAADDEVRDVTRRSEVPVTIRTGRAGHGLSWHQGFHRPPPAPLQFGSR